MARNEKIAIEIGAEDKASKVIDKLAKRIDGLEADEARIAITAQTEKLEAKLKRTKDQLDGLTGDELTVKLRAVGNLEADLKAAQDLFEKLDGATGKVDLELTGDADAKLKDVEKSADGSKSALANVVGNSAQDLGELGGVAGTTGVAIGQIAEYAADAALGGEKLTSVLKNFALVAGPIALITAALGVVNGIMGEQKAKSEAAAKATKELGDAMRGAADDAVGISDSLRTNVEDLRKFNAEAGTFSGLLGEYFGDIGRYLPLVGGLVGDAGENFTNLLPILDRAGVSFYDLGKAIKGGADPTEEWFGLLLDARDAGKITSKEVEALTQYIGQQSIAAGDAADAQKLWNVDLAEADALLQELINKSDPLGQFTDKWEILRQDMADGSIDFEDTAEAINFLAENLGLTQEEVIGLARESEETASSMREIGDAADDTIDALDRLKGSLSDQRALLNFGESAETMLQKFRDGVALSREDILGWNEDIITAADSIGNVPEEVVVNLVAQSDDGLTQAEVERTAALMQKYADMKTIGYRAVILGNVNTSSGLNKDGTTDRDNNPNTGGGRMLVEPMAVTAGQPITNNTYITVPTANPSAVMKAAQRWGRDNGRLMQMGRG
jgi:hypothetical protein